MNYEGQICRTPMERKSFMLPVEVGCSYNACRFCMLFKHLKYRELPIEQVEDELRRVANAGGNPRTVFLGDGNAFDIGYERIQRILDLVHSYFPECSSVNMDATVSHLEKTTDEELVKLRENGVDCLYIGIESGLDDVLKFMKKDHCTAQAVEQTERLRNAGINYGAHIMTGIAGKDRGIENAEATAEVLNRTGPVSVTNFSMFTGKRSPLWSSVEDGSFIPATVQEAMDEEYRLLQLLSINTVYDGFQDFIKVRTRGKLPDDRERMLKSLENKILEYRDKDPVYACVDVEPGVCACTCKESCYSGK